MIDTREIQIRMVRGERFSVRELLSWMSSEDPDALGAAFQALYARDSIDGAVDSQTANQFLVRYLVATMRRETSSAEMFSMQPYVAAHELARLYKYWRRAVPSDDRNLQRVRAELAELYVSGDELTRKVLVDGALEHIFEQRDCRADFADWALNERLRAAFDEALVWGMNHEEA